MGQNITVFTGHRNLTHDNLEFKSNDRVLCQRLLLEEFGVNLGYIPDQKNVVVDVLSKYPTDVGAMTKSEAEEIFMQRRIYEGETTLPLNLETIRKAQQSDDYLQTFLQHPKKKKNFSKQRVKNTDEIWHIRFRDAKEPLIYIPESLRKNLLIWYHEYL